MESVAVQEPVLQVLSSLGISGITAFLGYLWVKKDKQYTDLADKVYISFEKNAQINTKLEETIKNNTRIVEKLEETITNRVFDVLKEREK